MGGQRHEEGVGGSSMGPRGGLGVPTNPKHGRIRSTGGGRGLIDSYIVKK